MSFSFRFVRSEARSLGFSIAGPDVCLKEELDFIYNLQVEDVLKRREFNKIDLNDFIWFDCEEIFTALGMLEEEE